MKLNNKKISYVLLPIAFGVLLLGLSLDNFYPNVLFLSAFVTIFLCGIAIVPLWNQVERKGDELNNEKKREITPVFVTVTSALYAVIGGFAVTKAVGYPFGYFGDGLEVTNLEVTLDTLIPLLDELVRLKDKFLIMGVFLVTAIPFYHGAMMYLIRTPTIIVTESKQGQLFHFGFLFTQSMIFLGIALSLDSFPSILLLIGFLMVVDSVWIIFGQLTNIKPPVGWLCLNLGFFASIILISLPLWPFRPIEMLLFFAIGRTVIDYFGFKAIFFK